KLLNQHQQAMVYEQERELYHFFVNGLAVFESFGYAVYSLGSYLSPDFFPMQNDEQRRIISFRNTKNKLLTRFPKEQLSVTFRNSLNASYDDFVKMRTVLEHRTPGKIYIVSNEPTEWFILGSDTTTARRSVLSRNINQLFSALHSFVKN